MYQLSGYAKENPLSEGAKIGYAAGGVALLGLIAFYVYKKSAAAPAAKTGTVAFVASDFFPNTSSTPTYANGAIGSLQRSTMTNLSGTITSGSVAPGVPSVVNLQITEGDNTPNYPVGTTITGIPSNYIV